MSRIRSFSLPRFHSTRHEDAPVNEPKTLKPSQNHHHYHHHHHLLRSMHSRTSSAASTSSSPATPTFSGRGHHRWSSSTSTLATTPDSPINMAKPALHDLVEDPSEREDALQSLSDDLVDEPLCICDDIICEHRQAPYVNAASAAVLSAPEWSAGDEYFSDAEWNSEPSLKRRCSGEFPNEGITARLSRRFPSLSRRKREGASSHLPSGLGIHSAPASRAPSIKSAPARRPYPPPSERGSNTSLAHFLLTEDPLEENLPVHTRSVSSPAHLADSDAPETVEDPIDRQGMTSTPLLPPMMDDYRSRPSGQFDMVSPLQSPTIADMSMSATSLLTPVLSPYPTPPLSAKPSLSSFHPNRAGNGMSEVLPMSLSDETDPWVLKLGHANFNISPEPYMPTEITKESCQRLLKDWELARSEYLRQACRISEHYGPTSRIYQLTEEKWTGIDAEWRQFHERANMEAQSNGEAPVFQTLAENQQAISKIPTLNDPSQPAKFPCIDDAEIVGPMVQYAKVQQNPSKKKAFLRIFTDRASLLGAMRK